MVTKTRGAEKLLLEEKPADVGDGDSTTSGARNRKLAAATTLIVHLHFRFREPELAQLT